MRWGFVEQMVSQASELPTVILDSPRLARFLDTMSNVLADLAGAYWLYIPGMYALIFFSLARWL